MTPEEIVRKFAEIEAREKSNTKRLDKLESDHEVLARMATSIEVMATKQEAMVEKLDTVSEKVDVLEHVPAKRWNTFVGYLLSAAASALITFLITYLVG